MNDTNFDPSYHDRAIYKLWARDNVRLTDLDHHGHVSGVRVHELFATVRTLLFREAMPKWPKLDVLPVMKLNLVQHEREIGFPLSPDIGLLVEHFGTTSFSLVMAIFLGDHCMALNRQILIFIDGSTRKKAAAEDTVKSVFLRYTKNNHT